MTLSGTLREQAEQRLSISEADIPGMTAEDIHKLIYELQVHQIELELQNEDLRDAQAELAKAHDRFEALYEFAPVGYVTLDPQGKSHSGPDAGSRPQRTQGDAAFEPYQPRVSGHAVSASPGGVC